MFIEYKYFYINRSKLGLTQGGISELQGDDFLNGFASGTLGSWSGSAFGTTRFGRTKFGKYAYGGLAGGIGAAATGGNFWKGMGQGLITTGLNHGAHALSKYFVPSAPDGSDTRGYREMTRITKQTGNEVAAHEVETETRGFLGKKIIKRGLLIFKDHPDNGPNQSAVVRSINKYGDMIENIDGQTYKVKGHVHTHTSGVSTVSEADRITQGHYNTPLKILYDNSVYLLNIQQNRYVQTSITF